MAKNTVTVLATIGFLIAYLFLTDKARGQELEKYEPIAGGFCGDVQLNCVKMIPKGTDIFYAIIQNGKIIAITRVIGEDGKEEVVWGKLPRLPLKKGERDI